MSAAVVSPLDDPRFTLLQTPATREDFASDVRTGFTAAEKWLPPRWFYDALGSLLFDSICFLPEYYVMRAEGEALTRWAAPIVATLEEHHRVVELGSGTARKTRILLDEWTRRGSPIEYVPVDIDAATLERTGRELLREYPEVRVTAVASDFARPSVPLALLGPAEGRTAVLFLGSTIGNLSPSEAVAMLRDLRGALAAGDALLLGADLRKDPAILEAAYDDPLGVTAAFNRNLLGRINRELGGHFDLQAFRHQASYDPVAGRIQMHLVSTRRQTVSIDALNLVASFEEGERIHTESSYKHNEETLSALARDSGFSIRETWTDSRNWFADVLMVAE